VQSGVGKLSCTKTALKLCTSTETLWNRKAPSLSSPQDEEIFLPKLPKSWHADVFKGPKVSTAIGAKTANVGILFLLAGSDKLCCSTCLAGGPSDIGFSQGAGDSYVPAQCPAALPWTRVRPSGLFPSAEQPWWLFCHGSSG